MAFTPEDGSGLPDANSYITIEFFKEHHEDRGQFSPGDFSDTEIEQGCVNATDYVDKRFGRNYRGWKQNQQQGLEWPRIDAFDNDDFLFNGVDEIPRQLQKGTAEYALLAMQLARNLAPPPVPEFSYLDPESGSASSQGSGRVTKIREKVGPIETENAFDSTESGSRRAPTVKMSGIVANIPEYPQADLWIEELLVNMISRPLVRGS